MGIRIVSEGFSEQRVRRSVFRILQDNLLCSIATVTEDNRAYINTAYYCYSDELELYFLSDPTSRHCRNLSINSSMAITIFSSIQKWGGPDRGMQLFGTGAQARGPQATKAEGLYGKRFTDYAKWNAGLNTAAVGRTYRFYRFNARKLKVLDEAEFGEAVFVIGVLRRIGRLQ